MSKTILITGSTDGIGKLAAIKLAKDGHHIVLHGRNPEKLYKIIAEVKTLSTNENISGIAADLSDFKEIQKFIEEAQQIEKIDVLVNNAGIFKSPVDITASGIDIRLVVNYLAPYLITNELLSKLQLNPQSRIVNLSSAAQAPVSLEALKGKEELSVNSAYAQSKLALTMWTFYLANQLNEITVNAVNPGSLLNTKMANEAYGQHWAPADKGANIIYDLSVSSEYDGITGKYFDNDLGDTKGEFAEAHADAYDSAKIEALISATDEILSIIRGE